MPQRCQKSCQVCPCWVSRLPWASYRLSQPHQVSHELATFLSFVNAAGLFHWSWLWVWFIFRQCPEGLLGLPDARLVCSRDFAVLFFRLSNRLAETDLGLWWQRSMLLMADWNDGHYRAKCSHCSCLIHSVEIRKQTGKAEICSDLFLRVSIS